MILKADHKGRLTCSSIFTPFKTFSVNQEPDGSVRIVQMVEAPKKVPTIEEARRMFASNRFKVGSSWEELRKETREID